MNDRINYSNKSRLTGIGLFAALILLCNMGIASAQQNTTISGKLADKITNESISYANVGLFSTADSKLIHGIISDTSGYFFFSDIQTGTYTLKVSIIGYDPVSMDIHVNANTPFDAGIIFMNQHTVNLGETIITADRLKGRTEKDKTAYYITKKMSESSRNGLDIVKLVPGVQVDMMRNISLDGSQRILVLVDGKERDKNFVSQLIPDQIEKVEIISAPQAGYDGDVTGVMNIVLKKEKKSGINGQINFEIPISSVYYLHPDYTLNYTYKNLSLFTSYNGEIIHFDQQESMLRRIKMNDASYVTKSDQYVIQKTWSHNFHYGADYAINPKTKVSIYGFFNPYSQEYDGHAKAVSEMNNNGQWEASRNTSDMNIGSFYSAYIKHGFNERGGEFTVEISNYQLKGKNMATYMPASLESEEIKNISKPMQQAISLKADIRLPLGHNFSLSSGGRIRNYHMQDRNFDAFRYSGAVYAAYATFGRTLPVIDWNLGLRIEKSVSDLKGVFTKNYLTILPSASFGYKINADKTLKFALSNTVNRPNIYQLNPNISLDDPYSVRMGNPSIDPEIRTAVFLEYSRKMKSNFCSVRLFYNRTGSSINYMTVLNDSSVFETRTGNYGTIRQSGFQFSGTFKAGKWITVIPYLRLYTQFTAGNRLAEENFVNNRSQVVVEPGFSSLISLKHDFNIGMTLQYASPRNNITANSFSDPLYMISVDKTFKNRFKAGFVSALPFTRTFTYQGSEMKSDNIYSRYSGNIDFSKPLFWIKISYQFYTGKKQEVSKHGFDDIEAVPKKTGL